MRVLTIIFLASSFYLDSFGQISYEDRIRIREAKLISDQYGNLIWDGFNEPPFSILLITNDYEYLIEHYYQPDDFERLEFDTLVFSTIHRRSTKKNKSLLATFPFEGLNTIVIGIPENTGLNSTEWILTLLHERFHQYQFSAPKYFIESDALNLADGDDTGMWQLNYPFPYKNPKVVKAYEVYTDALYDAVTAIGTDGWSKALDNFMKKREIFKSSLTVDDYKYISFQWYQEGIARYTEFEFLELLADYEPTADLKKISDFIPFNEYRDTFYNEHLENVRTLKIEEVGRVAFYDVGFAEALILREVNPGWRRKYLELKFDLEKLY